MSERRQEDYDRDFSAMVSGMAMEDFGTDSTMSPIDPPDLRPTPPEPSRGDFNLGEALSRATPDEPDPSEYTPPPLPPMRAPRGLAALAWICFGYAVLALLLTIIGVRLPLWAGWAAVIAFVTAILVGWRLLPKDRDPDSGDGAVV